jgi:hypothetical protein
MLGNPKNKTTTFCKIIKIDKNIMEQIPIEDKLSNKIYIDNQLEPGYRRKLIEKLVKKKFSKEIISKNKSEAKLIILIINTGEVLINGEYILSIDIEDEYESDDTKSNKRRFEYFPLDNDNKLLLLNSINERLNNLSN